MSPSNDNSSLKLEITGRHVKVTPALRTFAAEKLVKLRRLVDGPLEVHAILTVEKHRHATEIVAHGRHLSLSARGVTADMYTSIGQCVEKLERQAKKHKEKYATRRRRALPQEAVADETPARGARALAPKRRRRGAAAGGDGPQIVRTAMPRGKQMSVEQAAHEVMGAEQGFIVFRNDRSQSINILFRRKDGRLGLIETEG